MRLLDSDIQDSRALVIDANPTSRSTMVGMLRDAGVGTVVQCSRASQARDVLTQERFDIVLCEHHFDTGSGEHFSGQDLLDELRRAQLLPYSTVFVMVTTEASYAQVAEAAESALDSYLLKPHTAQALLDRLMLARHRKRELKAIFDAIEAGQVGRAATLCVDRYSRKAEFGLYCARMGTELLLKAGQPEAARRLCVAVRDEKPLPWAKLGIARAELDAGQAAQAVATLQDLVNAHPAYADGLDLLAQVQMDDGQFEPALSHARRASALTPASIARLQRLGQLAFHFGEPADALKALDRVMVIGTRSKSFDPLSLALLALLRHAQGDGRALQRVHDTLASVVERALAPPHGSRKAHAQAPTHLTTTAAPARLPAPAAHTRVEAVAAVRVLQQADATAPVDAPPAPAALAQRRLQRLMDVVRTLMALQMRQLELAAQILARLTDAVADEDFDFEAALLVTALLGRWAAVTGSEGEAIAQAWQDAQRRIGLRYGVARHATEWLLAAARHHEGGRALIREALARIADSAEKALGQSLRGSAASAAQGLIRQGGELRNARLLELSLKVLQRHAERVPMHREMAEEARGLLQRYCPQGSQVGLVGVGRGAGALALRG